ncbi:lipid A core-O-antigen ligase-like enyme [Rivularia sp. PCC 7116]|uniref:O-antigen ligase family protein n=1 Tax=Rivularia sp. PCC 7116 TaxID=373994 RepID=UPI00029F4598|nr:O-antigen ligase [Rivularia sp. PCC 7116]AFY59074.1 lipid A core-O-antigen ligase-like enyme [Rivularia sp. PCC 7116]
MKKLLLFTEEAFTVVSLLLYSGGPLTVLLSGGASEGDDSGETNTSLILVLFFFNYLVTFFLLLLRWKKVIHVMKKEKIILLLVGIAVFSCVWSSLPKKTLTRGIAIVGTSLFGLYFASRYTIKQQLKLLGWMYGIAVIFSFIFIAALPKYGIMGGVHTGKWRGIYNHKNTLGKVIVPGIAVFLLLANSSKKYSWLLWMCFSLAFILLLRSGSTSSLLNGICLIAACISFRVFRWRDNIMVPSTIAIGSFGAIFYVIVSVTTEAILKALGKDTTLTGRGDMWPYIFEMIGQKPILGYGYGAFWSGPDTPSFYIWQATGWTPPNSHNGFLDLWLQIGLIGLLVYVYGFLAITIPKSFYWLRTTRTSEGFWPLVYMTYMLLANISETTLMIQNDLFWVIYVAIAFSVKISPENHRSEYINQLNTIPRTHR